MRGNLAGSCVEPVRGVGRLRDVKRVGGYADDLREVTPCVEHAHDVVFGFVKRRDAAVLGDRLRTCVVGREDQAVVVRTEATHEPAEIASGAGKILTGISRVNTEAGGRPGHQLAESDRS